MTIVDRLLRDLGHEQTVVAAASRSGEYLINSYRGRPLDPPARLLVNERDLEARLAAIEADDPQAVFPDVDRRTAAYGLLLNSLEEEIMRFDGRIAVLQVTSQSVRAVPSEEHRSSDQSFGGGKYVWTAVAPGETEQA